jgi:hypothetical protein
MADASAGGASAAPGARLMILKMEVENFKSYGGVKEIGPFHKSCVVVARGPASRAAPRGCCARSRTPSPVSY